MDNIGEFNSSLEGQCYDEKLVKQAPVLTGISNMPSNEGGLPVDNSGGFNSSFDGQCYDGKLVKQAPDAPRPVRASDRPSSIVLGQNASKLLLAEQATPGNKSFKRVINTSPESDFVRPRKLSIDESYLAGSPKQDDMKERIRRNTCGAMTDKKVLGGRRKHKTRLPDLKNQILINQLFKPVGKGNDDENLTCRRQGFEDKEGRKLEHND